MQRRGNGYDDGLAAPLSHGAGADRAHDGRAVSTTPRINRATIIAASANGTWSKSPTTNGLRKEEVDLHLACRDQVLEMLLEHESDDRHDRKQPGRRDA